MDLIIINEMIDELENADTSLSNIRNLSALYNVRTQLIGSNVKNSVVKELNDILPSYTEYVNLKKRYQLKEITVDNVLIQLNNVCREIKEFIQALYCGTDNEQERELLDNLIKSLT